MKPKSLAPAQRIACHPLSWHCLLQSKLDKLSFPSLTQGADKLTEAKRLAGVLSILQHNEPDFAKSPLEWDGRGWKVTGNGCTCFMAMLGRRLAKAVLEHDTKFLSDFRKASKTQSPLRSVYSWMLAHGKLVEACRSKGEILRLVKQHCPRVHFDERRFYKMLAEVNLPKLPLSKPSKF